MIEIEICMGSSCFARGNREALEILEDHLAQHPEIEAHLSGRLCLEECACGPHVIVDGVRYDLVAPEGVLDILDARVKT
ncbi:MAG: NAD(P)H-dependent oxidoreductase subunit E [Spirochaetales bacterium]|nr:NAD(P)H-dependent oxidoreductase subunit E [Spirochaetales bacterium]